MSNDVFPNLVRGLTWNVTRTPEFSTIVQEAPNFVETRIMQARNPRWHYDLTFDYLKDIATDLAAGLSYTDFKTLIAFWLGHYAQFDDFLVNDIWTPDNYVGPAMITGAPNTDAQLQLIQDANTGTWYSPLQRKWAGAWLEDIADLNGAVAVYANGTLTTDYTIGGPGLAISGYSFIGKYLQWNAEPTAPITAQFYFYWRSRFEDDQQDFDKWAGGLWTAGGHKSQKSSSIKIKTTRSYLAS
jgi:hypothetical protein